MPVFLAQGPMSDGAALTTAVQAVITAVNSGGGNAHFLDLRGPSTDGAFMNPCAAIVKRCFDAHAQ